MTATLPTLYVGKQPTATELNQIVNCLSRLTNYEFMMDRNPAFTTTSTSYTDLTGESLQINKLGGSSDSNLLVGVGFSAQASGAGIQHTFGVNISSTDYDMVKFLHNEVSKHHHSSAFRLITGLGSGLLTIQGRIKTASGTLTIDTNDTIWIAAQEIPL